MNLKKYAEKPKKCIKKINFDSFPTFLKFQSKKKYARLGSGFLWRLRTFDKIEDICCFFIRVLFLEAYCHCCGFHSEKTTETTPEASEETTTSSWQKWGGRNFFFNEIEFMLVLCVVVILGFVVIGPCYLNFPHPWTRRRSNLSWYRKLVCSAGTSKKNKAIPLLKEWRLLLDWNPSAEAVNLHLKKTKFLINPKRNNLRTLRTTNTSLEDEKSAVHIIIICPALCRTVWNFFGNPTSNSLEVSEPKTIFNL